MNKLKETYNKICTALKRQYIFRLCASLKRTYGYYYYLCLKDFIKKLLNPKKMIAIKWRINTNDDFKYVTEIEDSEIFNSSNLIDCSNSPDKFKFRVKTPNIETTIEPESYFYVINPNTLYWFNNAKMKWEIFYGEILEYEYQSNKIKFYFNKLIKNSNSDTHFFLNLRNNSIIKIDGTYCDFCNNLDNNLTKENLNKFIDFFRI